MTSDQGLWEPALHNILWDNTKALDLGLCTCLKAAHHTAWDCGPQKVPPPYLDHNPLQSPGGSLLARGLGRNHSTK